ncbi:hypothetical protein PG996_007551 [Apiospora saccharicola]|uniref:Phosphatidate cytidylyltransferase, mitochondrial n=1 Tax=Apiospora saccharicola TaxID=335842 RepID=A0ABR1VB55_9PEZI
MQKNELQQRKRACGSYKIRPHPKHYTGIQALFSSKLVTVQGFAKIQYNSTTWKLSAAEGFEPCTLRKKSEDAPVLQAALDLNHPIRPPQGVELRPLHTMYGWCRSQRLCGSVGHAHGRYIAELDGLVEDVYDVVDGIAEEGGPEVTSKRKREEENPTESFEVAQAERVFSNNRFKRLREEHQLPHKIVTEVGTPDSQKSSDRLPSYGDKGVAGGQGGPAKGYGAACTSSMPKKNLRDWNTLYLASRLHKPFKILRDDPPVRMANQINLLDAVRTALLMLPAWYNLSHALAAASSGTAYVLLPPGKGREGIPPNGHFALDEIPYFGSDVERLIRICAQDPNHQEEIYIKNRSTHVVPITLSRRVGRPCLLVLFPTDTN